MMLIWYFTRSLELWYVSVYGSIGLIVVKAQSDNKHD